MVLHKCHYPMHNTQRMEPPSSNRMRSINRNRNEKMDISHATELIPEQTIKYDEWNTAENYEHDKIAQLTMHIALEAICSLKVVTRM